MDEPVPRSSRPILLVGMPGSGKSTIGPLLAERLGLPFHDCDAMIEQQLGMTVAQIFARLGEARFRAEEKGLIGTLLEAEPAVIGAGGGAFLDPEIREAALKRAVPVWLDAGLATLAKRLRGVDERPLLAGRDALAAMKAQRDPVYALAPMRVDATLPPGEVVGAIATALAEPAR